VLALPLPESYYVHNYQSGYYDYTISTDGLSDYCGGLVNEIVVPIPVIGDEQIFSDMKLQKKISGDWTSLMFVSKDGKMLVFPSFWENLSVFSSVTACP